MEICYTKTLGYPSPWISLLNLGLKEGERNRNGGGGGGGLISINTKFNFLREKQIGCISAMSYIP